MRFSQLALNLFLKAENVLRGEVSFELSTYANMPGKLDNG